MKTRNLFLSLFAFAALCACNKEEQPDVPQVLDAETYMKVNIMATGASTKAYAYGTEDENAVYNALFLFYDENNSYVADVNQFSWEKKTLGDNIARTATIKLPAKTNKPASMLVILNYDNTVSYDGMTLDAVKAAVNESYSIFDDTDKEYFTMTNSVFADGDDVKCEVLLTDANFGKTTEDGGQADAVTPVDVYVERVAAKVVFNTTMLSSGIQSTEEEVDGATAVITPVVKGYTVINTPNKSYDFKNIDTDWKYSASANGSAAWNNAADFRSYWASMPGDVTYSELKFDDIEEDNHVYVHENTSLTPANNTKVILTAELQIDGVAVNLVRYNDTYYTLDNFKNLALAQVADAAVTTDMLDPVAGDGVGISNGYEMVLQLNSNYTGDDEDDINTELKKMSAMYWNAGRCYYYTEIKHDLYDGEELMSGVVRNHVYELNLNGVRGLGVAVPDPEADIDPEEPSDEYYSLNATINILQWKVVNQSVIFGE